MRCEYCNPERYEQEPCEKYGGTGACFKCWAYQRKPHPGASGCSLSEQRKLKHKFCFNCGSPLSDPTPLNLDCGGCQHLPDRPSHVRCHGCARMYTDNYTHKPKDREG